MKITRSFESIKIDQSTYAGDVVKRFEHLLLSHLDKTYTTPMDRDIKITKVDFAEMTREQAHIVATFLYQNAIGALLYLSVNTRPDLPYSVGILARHCINPSFKACQAVVRIISSQRSMTDIGIEFRNNELDPHTPTQMRTGWRIMI